MAETIKVNQFTATLQKTLTDYGKDTSEKLKKIAEEIANEATEMLRQKSSAMVWGHKGEASGNGQYAKGWKVKAQSSGLWSFEFIVYNTNGQLTHLLEFEHFWRGKRKKFYPKAKHITPVADWCNKEFEKRVQKELGS